MLGYHSITLKTKKEKVELRSKHLYLWCYFDPVAQLASLNNVILKVLVVAFAPIAHGYAEIQKRS